MPELATIGARWRAYVTEQGADDLDIERVSRTGQDYLEKAIDAAIEPDS